MQSHITKQSTPPTTVMGINDSGKLDPRIRDTAAGQRKFITENLTSNIPPNAKGQSLCTSKDEAAICLYSR